MGFDGGDDYVDCGSKTPLVMGTKNWSVMCWVNLDQLGSDVANDVPFVANRVDANDMWYFYINAVDRLTFYADIDGVEDTYIRHDSASIGSTGSWYHVAASVERGTAGKLYVDGVEVGGYQSQVVGSGNVDANSPVLLGKRGTDAIRLDGLLDTIAILRTALTPDQIKLSSIAPDNANLSWS